MQVYKKVGDKIVKKRIRHKQVKDESIYLDYMNKRGSVKRIVRGLKNAWLRQEGKIEEEEGEE